VAENVNGQVTAVARRDTAQYAFYRGTQHIGAPPEPSRPANAGATQPGQAVDQSDLGKNVKELNYSNSIQQLDRLNNRFQNPRNGINPSEAR
jgi:alpha-2-macroglobulin